MNNIRRKSRGVVRGDERKNRSEVPLEAARLYLEAAADRSNALALALATSEGLLIAGTRGDFDLDGIAAIGVACARGESDDALVDRTIDEVALGEDVYATGVTIADMPFYLMSVGARVRSVKDTAAALSRILSPVLGASPAYA